MLRRESPSSSCGVVDPEPVMAKEAEAILEGEPVQEELMSCPRPYRADYAKPKGWIDHCTPAAILGCRPPRCGLSRLLGCIEPVVLVVLSHFGGVGITANSPPKDPAAIQIILCVFLLIHAILDQDVGADVLQVAHPLERPIPSERLTLKDDKHSCCRRNLVSRSGADCRWKRGGDCGVVHVSAYNSLLL